MNRVVQQLKRKIDGIDFRKIYYNFEKMPFLIKKDTLLYDLNQSYKDLEINNNKTILNSNVYVVLDITNQEINFKDLTIELVMLMFKAQMKKVNNIFTELKYLQHQKTNDYYVKKYQEHLYAAGALRGNFEYLKKYSTLNGIRKKDAFVENVEKKLESYVGLEKYIKLRLLELFNPDEYSYELQIIYEKLEDPCNLINYIQNIEYYSAVYLLLSKKAIEEKIELVECEITMPLFNFENLLKENDSIVKKILMHKMINARKSYIKGKIIYAKLDKVKVSGNLYYFPEQITLFTNNRVTTKKGDYIVKLNENYEIEEAYECFLISKILA
jgi:hypothetical protein